MENKNTFWVIIIIINILNSKWRSKNAPRNDDNDDAVHLEAMESEKKREIKDQEGFRFQGGSL